MSAHLDTVSRREQARSQFTGQFGTQDRTGPSDDFNAHLDVHSIVQKAVATELHKRYSLQSDAIDFDDLVQEVCVAYYESMNRRRSDYAVAHGLHEARPVQNVEGFVTIIARRTIARVLTPAAVSGRDWQARRIFHGRIAELEADGRREVHQAERDAIAEEVRMSFPANKRPRDGYHLTSSDLSLDDENFVFDVAAPEHVEAEDFEAGSVGDRVLDMAERGETREARNHAWDAIAELRGAPAARHGEITERRALNARKVTTGFGGAHRAMAAYLDHPERLSTREADAMFAPFTDGDNPASRRKIAATFKDLGNHADALYDAAVGAATIARIRGAK